MDTTHETHVELPITVRVTYVQPAERADDCYPGCPASVEWEVVHDDPAVARAIEQMLSKDQVERIERELLAAECEQ